jgi:cytidylate kinase
VRKPGGGAPAFRVLLHESRGGRVPLMALAGPASMKPMVIAIDGPSGAGKGTVARALATRLGYQHVDTGAMYRAVAWQAVRRGLSPADEQAMAALAERATLDIEGDIVRIDGHDVTQAIRTPEIDRAAAVVARLPKVREALVARQRAVGGNGRVVMEGRDVGTVVFPHAEVKIYLDASPEERARRRAADPAHAAGRQAALADVASDLQARDHSDRTRATSPLTMAADAILVETTNLTIQEVVDRVFRIVEEKLAASGS